VQHEATPQKFDQGALPDDACADEQVFFAMPADEPASFFTLVLIVEP
jgi:hypothetical protein